MEEGRYTGIPFIGLKATNFEKNTAITMKHVYLEHYDDRFHRLPDDVDDKYSLYKLLKHHLEVNCPPNVGRIFRHKANRKQLQVSSLFLVRISGTWMDRNRPHSPSWSKRSTFVSFSLCTPSAVLSLIPALVPVPLYC
jgi:hypothetical protein